MPYEPKERKIVRKYFVNTNVAKYIGKKRSEFNED